MLSIHPADLLFESAGQVEGIVPGPLLGRLSLLDNDRRKQKQGSKSDNGAKRHDRLLQLAAGAAYFTPVGRLQRAVRRISFGIFQALAPLQAEGEPCPTHI